MSAELRQSLERVARRVRHVRLWSALALCWLAWALVGLGLFALLSMTGRAAPLGDRLLVALAALAGATAIACASWALRSARDPRWVARRIEAKHPELGTGLLAAVEQAAAPQGGRLGFLQTAVIREALKHDRSHDWGETVPSTTLRGTKLAHAAALALLIVASAALVGEARSHSRGRTSALLGADASGVQVDPGNAEIERGTSLLVVAKFPGAVPADATLVVEGGNPADGRRAMTRSLEDPTFAGRVESVDADLAYRVEFDGRSTESYRIRVFEYPELLRTDAQLVFPGYTGLESKTVEDIRHVTAVEGTALTLLCRLNKDVSEAKLVDEKDEVTPLAPVEGGNHLYRAAFTLAETHRYRVRLVDREGRPNKLSAEIVVNVSKNHPPVVKMSHPSRDVRVSPVEELSLKAGLEDDYGLVRHGVSYTLAGQPPRDVVLKNPEKPGRRLQAEHQIDFEALGVAPDQLLTYVFWAEDVGPDGKPRRASGDMFFAEVRHFEEIFRQGEQPPGGSAEMEGNPQNAQQAEQLAELQKQIINGTWTLIRREIAAKPTDKLADDAKVLRESQRSAIEKAGPLGERLQDPKSKESLERAVKFMKEAEGHLQGAEKPSIASLNPALVAEQAAYQALLKLRAREFQVIRSNSRQRQGGGGGGGASQQQLQQLELSNDENRYEDQRSARAQQERLSQREREQRETRQVLNRLRELAQRQGDLNERLKELQSALEAAKTPQAREEIERQLKRLRDQQQQVLRDTDELRERMEREENRERMAEARQQIEQGREHVRQASEALEQGRLSQAVTEGARAGRQLNDLREDLRKKSSDRFTEELTEMRDQARKLDEDQDKLSKQLEAWKERPRRSLRDTGERAELGKGLQQQQKGLEQLVERMQRTVQDAEETEPLLAKGLYDTVRKANEQKIPDALKVAEQLAQAGIPEEAAKASRHAGQGLDQVREGVERAARGVLGDETAALRRAQGEIEDLAEQVNRELAQASGQPNQGRTSGAQRPGEANRGEQGRQRREGGERQAQGEQPEGQGEQAEEGQQEGQQEQQKGQGGQQKGQRGRRAQQGQQKGQGGQQGQQEGQGGQQGQEGDPQEGQGGQQGQQEQDGHGHGPGSPGGEAPQQDQARPRGGRPSGARQERQAGPLRPGGGGGGGNRQDGLERLLDGVSAGNGPGGPITGEGFREWSDRMRDVEELLENPEMRAEAARIRDRVRGEREEFKKHAKEPDWTRLKDMVAEPLQELHRRISEEVRRRESPDALVPIDRDPVPPQYAEGVRRYYERLGSGR